MLGFKHYYKCVCLERELLADLDKMRCRVMSVRQEIAAIEQQDFGRDSLSYLTQQSGMFSLLPLNQTQEIALTQEHGIHVVKGGRVNVARLSSDDMPTLIRAFHAVTAKTA